MSASSRASGASAPIAAQIGFGPAHVQLVSAQRAFISPQLQLVLPQSGYVLLDRGPVSCRSVLAQLLFILAHLENVCCFNLSLLTRVDFVLAQLRLVLAYIGSVRTTQTATVFVVASVLVARIRRGLPAKRRTLLALAAHVAQARIVHRAKSLWAAGTKSATVALGSGESSNPETADCQNG